MAGKETKGYVKMLERAAEKYSKFMLFAYGNAELEALASTKDIVGKVPGAMLRFSDRSFIPYPHDWAFDDSHMDKFVEMYLRKKLNKTNTDNTLSKYAQAIRKELIAVKILSAIRFDDTINQIFIFFFSSLREDAA